MIINYQTKYRQAFIDCVTEMWKEESVVNTFEYEHLDPYRYIDKASLPNYVLLVDVQYPVVKYDEQVEITGFIWGKKDLREMRIHSLYVKPVYRRAGLGAQLKETLKQIAERAGLKRITTTNMFQTKSSYDLNKKLGWTIEPIDKYYYEAYLDLSVDKMHITNDEKSQPKKDAGL